MQISKLILLCTLLAAALPAVALNVFACEPEWQALAQEIGEDKISATSATTALQDPHHIQARPSLLAKIRRADLVICSGAELEIGWLPVLLQRGNNPNVRPGTPGFLEASAFVQLKDIPDTADRAQGDVHLSGNPHIQLDAHNIARIAKVLAARMVVLDPNNAPAYESGYADFDKRWQAAIQKWEANAAPLKGMPIVVHHKTWFYLEDWLGLNKIAELEPKPGVQPSVAHLQSVLTALKKQPARIIIRAPYFSSQASEWLSKRTGVPAVVLPTTVGGTPEAKNLFAMFDAIINSLLQAGP